MKLSEQLQVLEKACFNPLPPESVLAQWIKQAQAMERVVEAATDFLEEAANTYDLNSINLGPLEDALYAKLKYEALHSPTPERKA